MFLKKLREQVNQLSSKIEEFSQERIKTVDCEICGCLINKSKAIEGDDVIRHKYFPGFAILTGIPVVDDKYIYTPYYCKRCSKETAAKGISEIVKGDKITIGKPPKFKVKGVRK